MAKIYQVYESLYKAYHPHLLSSLKDRHVCVCVKRYYGFSIRKAVAQETLPGLIWSSIILIAFFPPAFAYLQLILSYQTSLIKLTLSRRPMVFDKTISNVCFLLLPALRLHCFVFPKASYLPFSVTAVEWQKECLSSHGYSKVMESLSLLGCGS